MGAKDIRVNDTTILRESHRQGPDTVSYVVLSPTERYWGSLHIADGKLAFSSGIDPGEYDQVKAVLPGVDFSLWSRSL